MGKSDSASLIPPQNEVAEPLVKRTSGLGSTRTVAPADKTGEAALKKALENPAKSSTINGPPLPADFTPVPGTFATVGQESGQVYITAQEDDERTTDTPLRYAAYLGRLARLSRYLAYTSDLGEAARPVAHPWLVRGAYGVSWAYVGYDIVSDGYNANTRYGIEGNDLAQHVTQRATFQVIASMALPSLTIHSIVHYGGAFFKKIGRFQKYGGTVCGVLVMPALPFMFDEPVEHMTSRFFHTVWPVKKSVIHSTTQFHE